VEDKQSEETGTNGGGTDIPKAENGKLNDEEDEKDVYIIKYDKI
jgi:hypothetical protein